MQASRKQDQNSKKKKEEKKKELQERVFGETDLSRL